MIKDLVIKKLLTCYIAIRNDIYNTLDMPKVVRYYGRNDKESF